MITSEVDPLVWSEVGRRLRGLLRKRGATTWVAEDLAQEVLTRAVAHRVSFDDADDLMRWCVPVARNLHVDHARHGRWTDEGAIVPESRDPLDVERLVLARLELKGVLQHLGSLAGADRQAIVDGVNGVSAAESRKASVAESVRRHRARQRLARLVAGAAAVWGWLLHPRTRVGRPALIVALPAAAFSMLVVPWAPGPAGPAPAPSPAVVTSLHTSSGSTSVPRLPTAVTPRAAADARTAGVPPTSRGGAARTHTVRERLATGNGFGIGATERPADGVVLCVEDFPVVADTCLVSPVTTDAASARLVVSGERTG